MVNFAKVLTNAFDDRTINQCIVNPQLQQQAVLLRMRAKQTFHTCLKLLCVL